MLIAHIIFGLLIYPVAVPVFLFQERLTFLLIEILPYYLAMAISNSIVYYGFRVVVVISWIFLGMFFGDAVGLNVHHENVISAADQLVYVYSIAWMIGVVFLSCKAIEKVSELSSRIDRKPHVMVVDDDEVMAIDMADFIYRKWAYKVAVLFNAEEAIEYLKEYPDVDLVITDYVMPGKDGIELAIAIKSGWESEVIVISAHGEIKETALESGARYFFKKPYKYWELEKAIEESLNFGKKGVLWKLTQTVERTGKA